MAKKPTGMSFALVTIGAIYGGLWSNTIREGIELLKDRHTGSRVVAGYDKFSLGGHYEYFDSITFDVAQ
jgi:hypothetical protein